MVGVIVFGRLHNRRTILYGLLVSRCRCFVLTAKRHRNRVQVLQRQAGNQHQQSESFQKMFHAPILIIQCQV